MKTFILAILALILTTLFSKCDTNPPAPEGKNLEIPVEFSSQTTSFALDFIKQLNKFETPSKNFFVSPLSLHMALGMLLNGADNNSKTEILKTLHLEGSDLTAINENYKKLIDGLPDVDPKVTNLLANSIWQEKTFPVENDFISLLKKSFNSDIYSEDFSNPGTVEKINNWASEHTKGKVDQILEHISADQVMFLINALYFKGDWSNQFDKKKTYKTDFNGRDKVTTVDMMSKTDTFAYYYNDKYQAIKLLYGSGKYSMTILLPEKGSIDDLINKLTINDLEEIRINKNTPKVILGLPKFTMKYSIELNDILSDMGMPTLFTAAADLSKISPPAGKIQVGFVKQDTYVGIDEVGTEAAAVTTIGIELTSVPVYPQFVCNRPFVFMITENSSSTIQFMGKIVNF